MESLVFVKKSRLPTEDDTSSCDENSDGRSDDALPEIEARISEKDVLVRIHCEKRKGVAVKIIGELENLHLSIVNSTVLPFGDTTVNITIIARVISVSRFMYLIVVYGILYICLMSTTSNIL